jgi:membrane protein implicated in regulation of membrane protease activity
VAAFILIALIGLFFLIVSALFGDHDADHSIETAHEVAFAEHPSPFSLRVISLFLTAFGAVGAMARLYGLGYTGSTVAGILAGAVVGFAAYKLISLFMGQQSSSGIEAEELVGIVGQVSVAIPDGGLGQVSVVVKEKRVYPMARAASAGVIVEGTEVRIVRSTGNTVYVERL